MDKEKINEPKLILFEDFYQDEVDKWIREYCISDTCQLAEFDHFFKEYKILLKNHEALLRMSQSFVNVLTESEVDFSKCRILFIKFVSQTSKDADAYPSKLVELLKPFIDPDLDEYEKDVIKNRNVCLTLLLMLDQFVDSFEPLDNFKQILQYLIKKIQQIDCLESVLYSVLSLEKIYIKNCAFFVKEKNSISDILEKLPKNFEVDKESDSLAAQICFCADWMLKNLITKSSDDSLLKCPIKFSPDRLTVRNDSTARAPVRFDFPVTSGIFFYQIVPFSSGSVQIGWSTSDEVLNKTESLGTGKLSIGFDFSICKIVHNKTSYKTEENLLHTRIDSIGSLINLDTKEFVFYLNGEEHTLGIDIEVHFSSEPYYATVFLSPYQQVSFNFGQHPFVEPPKNILYQTFIEDESNKESSLLSPFTVGNSYWFKPGKNSYYKIFSDENQIKFDQILLELETTICANEIINKMLSEKAVKLFKEFENQSFYRLSQSLLQAIGKIFEFDDKVLHLVHFIQKNRSPIPEISKCLELIHQLILVVKQKSDQKASNYQKEINICLILLIILEKHSYNKKDILTREVFEFVWKIFSESKHELNKLIALVCIEHVGSFENIFSYSLKSNPLNEFNISNALEPNFNFLQYQIAFRAVTAPASFKSSQIFKQFANSSLRNDSSNCAPVRASFEVISGVYFYEVISLTDRTLMAGWSTRESIFLENESTLDSYSIMFDFVTKSIQHGGKKLPIKNAVKINKKVNVLGCLIDVSCGKFAFYLNGCEIDYPTRNVHFSKEPYFASAQLSLYQHCLFNFGQEDFAHPPKDLFETFHPKEMHFLVQPEKFAFRSNNFRKKPREYGYWFKEEPSHEKVSFFRDSTIQKEYNWQLEYLELRIQKADLTWKYAYEVLKPRFKELLATNQGSLRLIQAIIEGLGKSSKSNIKIDVIVHWIETFAGDHFIAVPKNKFLEIFQFYITKPESLKQDYRMRNLVIVLSIMLRRMSQEPVREDGMLMHVMDPDDSEIESFYTKEVKILLSKALIVPSPLTGKESRDEALRILYSRSPIEPTWSLLFAIMAFEQFKSQLTIWQIFELRSESQQIVNLTRINDNWYELDESLNPLYRLCSKSHQIEFMSNYCFEYSIQLKIDPSAFYSDEETLKYVLDCESGNLKLSEDKLAVRCDWQWASYRSDYAFSGNLAFPIYFYEVLHVTSGPVRIGWSTKDADSGHTTQLGEDKHSIGFDWYSKCVWHQGKRYPLESMLKTSQLSDKLCNVIGCLIDLKKRKFTFYFNGEKVKFKNRKLYFSNEIYYSAVSLGSHQQIHFNYGDKYYAHAPPKGIQYYKLHSSAPKFAAQGLLCNICRIRPSTAQFIDCDHWKLCSECLNKLAECPLCKFGIKPPASGFGDIQNYFKEFFSSNINLFKK